MGVKNKDGYVKSSRIKRFANQSNGSQIGGICPICNMFHLGTIKCNNVEKYNKFLKIYKNE